MDRELELIEELIAMQSDKLLAAAREIMPNATTDDILQPNDFPELELNPLFRYEEGILAGLLMTKTALLAESKARQCDNLC